MKYRILVSLIFVTVVFSCKKDDDGIVEVPPSLLSDVAPEDDATIKEFLNTHFYNYEDFDELTMPEGFDYKIVIDTLAGDNAGKRSLMEDAQSVKIKVNSDYLGLSAGEEDIEHTLYYIVVRPGGGGSPTYADSTLVRYQGSLLNGKLFDESQDFTWQELPVTVRGYGNGVAMLNAGTEDQIVENGDGTYDILNSGLGIIVMPSGLAYFNSSNSSLIPSYSPILFKVELGLYVEDTDRDNDGIPSIEEDLNG
ncbi:MAG: peptidylprolyl isomerase, partial [Bacteroidota bacterium]|nr:peptidylprolyl isomerase [Bacteroidota bacterium]